MSTSQAVRLSHGQRGVSSIEYALLGALIAVVCALTITAVGTETLALYQVICNGVARATGGQPCS